MSIQQQAERAATAVIVETGVRTPIVRYETLHAVVTAAFLEGLRVGLRTARLTGEILEAQSFPDALSDPSDAEIRHE